MKIGKDKVDIGVVIATRDRAPSLERTLDHLGRQVLPGISWEIIVIDNNSSDNTSLVLQRASNYLPLLHFHEEIPGKNRALNKALEFAGGELIVFTDDDVIPDGEWLASLVAATCRWPNDSIFGGRLIPRFPTSTAEWLRDPTPP